MTMCDWTTQQLVEQLVQEKCRAGRMFTAFDVSREAKRRGSRERHRAMKHVVHRCFAQGTMPGYQRMLIGIPGTASPAWLYFHAQTDPSKYKALDRSTFPSSRCWAASRNGYYRVDNRARVCVPVRLVRRAGFRPGESVWAVAARWLGRLLLTKSQPRRRGYVVIGTYRVDKDGNVRIAQGTLKRAHLGGRAYDMDGDADKVRGWLHRN